MIVDLPLERNVRKKVCLYAGAALVVLTILVLPFVWMVTGPSWQLSARNAPEGLRIEVYKSNMNTPTFRTTLKGETISTEIDRVGYSHLPADVGKTTFHEETMPPGRWTVLLEGKTELDIMEGGMTVNGGEVILPDY